MRTMFIMKIYFNLQRRKTNWVRLTSNLQGRPRTLAPLKSLNQPSADRCFMSVSPPSPESGQLPVVLTAPGCSRSFHLTSPPHLPATPLPSGPHKAKLWGLCQTAGKKVCTCVCYLRSAATCWLQQWTHWIDLRIESKSDGGEAEGEGEGHPAESWYPFTQTHKQMLEMCSISEQHNTVVSNQSINQSIKFTVSQ